jgi:hypothetical protein
VSLLIRVKVNGEVRDAKTGAILYKIANEATGVATGDVCPDASGTARAEFSFRGREDYFDASGATTGTGVIEGFTGDVRIKADDNAKVAGVDITTTGGLDAGVLSKELGFELIRLAAQRSAPEFEKGWRSGICIAVLVSPEGGDVEKDSVTTVTAKVKHKIEGNELDKPVEAKLDGVKSIEPAGKKQKAPATFKYTAGSKDGDRGNVSLESVSNRGIGREAVTFTVGGGWTINSTGTLNFGDGASVLEVSLINVKVTAGEVYLSGHGTIAFKGRVQARFGDELCTGQVDRAYPVTATGHLVGSGPAGLLRLTFHAPTPRAYFDTPIFKCSNAFEPWELAVVYEGDHYFNALNHEPGALELPAAGGTRSFTGADGSDTATATVNVVRGTR